MYAVVVHRRAVRYLNKLPLDQQARIKYLLNEIGNDPSGLANTKNMVGDWEGYRRARIGGIRIIFWIDEGKKTVYVDHIGPRGDIYKSGA